MKHVILFVLVCCTYTGLFAQSNRQLLQQLDKAIADKAIYQRQRYAQADSLTRLAASQEGRTQVNTLLALYDTYLHFHTDSAISTLGRLKSLPEVQADHQLQQQMQLHEAQVYGMMGLYSTAFALMHDVDRSSMDSSTLLIYYNARHAVLGWMAEYADQSAPGLAQAYQQQALAYHDSLLALEPDPLNRSIIHSNRDYDLGRYNAALDTLEQLFSRCDPSQRIYVYSNLSQVYHQLQRSEDEMHYLILTAIADIQAGVTEYMALPLLAYKLHELGDADRAYSYLYCALEDANLSKASLRTIEVTEFFPIIHQARQRQLAQRRTLTWLIIALLVLLAAALAILVAGQLRRNSRLEQADRQKGLYLKSYLTRSRDYLTSAETFRKQLLTLFQSHQDREVLRLLKENRHNDEEAHFLNDFDRLFLDLYPDFIDKFNALLKPECRISPRKDELLTTELRIFALIRMGITESSQIARFLNYSLVTIYNYRSRTRNNALGDKEQFEQEVSKL